MKTTLNQAAKLEMQTSGTVAALRPFTLVAFPKEFQKDLWKSLDKRFWSIFLVTLLFVYGLLLKGAMEAIPNSKIQIDVDKFLKKHKRSLGISNDFIKAMEDLTPKSKPDEITGYGNVNRPGRTIYSSKDPNAIKNLVRQQGGMRVANAQNRVKKGLEGFLSQLNNGKGSMDGNLAVLENNTDYSIATIGYDIPSDDPGSRYSVKVGSVNGNQTIGEIDLNIEKSKDPLVNVKNSEDNIIQFSNSSIEKKSMSASVTVESINSAISAYETSIQVVYGKFLNQDPSLKGKVSFRITFNAAGRVIGISIAENTTDNSQFAETLAGKIRAWQMPKFKGGQVTITQSFVFGK